MSTGVMARIVIFIIGILVLVQLLFYNSVQSANLARSQNARIELQQEIEQLTLTRQEQQDYLAALQDEYSEIVSSVPERILHGYEDHEVILASFLDYLKNSDSDKVKASVTIQGARKYVNRPVPLFEYDITFNFSFRRLPAAKRFLALVLGQDEYPLVVRSLELRKSGTQEISGILMTSLLIPARTETPLFDAKDREK